MSDPSTSISLKRSSQSHNQSTAFASAFSASSSLLLLLGSLTVGMIGIVWPLCAHVERPLACLKMDLSAFDWSPFHC